MADKSVREELAELAEAVRELREDEVTAELRRLRAGVEKLRTAKDMHHCHGCSCAHVHWYTNPYTWTYPTTVTYPQYMVTSGTSVVNTVAAAGGPSSTYTFSTTN